MSPRALLRPVPIGNGVVACVIPRQNVVLFDLSDGRVDASLDLRSGSMVNIDEERAEVLRETLAEALKHRLSWVDDLTDDVLDILHEAYIHLGGTPPTLEDHSVVSLSIAADITLVIDGQTCTVTLDDDGTSVTMDTDLPVAARHTALAALIARLKEIA